MPKASIASISHIIPDGLRLMYLNSGISDKIQQSLCILGADADPQWKCPNLSDIVTFRWFDKNDTEACATMMALHHMCMDDKSTITVLGKEYYKVYSTNWYTVIRAYNTPGISSDKAYDSYFTIIHGYDCHKEIRSFIDNYEDDDDIIDLFGFGKDIRVFDITAGHMYPEFSISNQIRLPIDLMELVRKLSEQPVGSSMITQTSDTKKVVLFNSYQNDEITITSLFGQLDFIYFMSRYGLDIDGDFHAQPIFYECDCKQIRGQTFYSIDSCDLLFNNIITTRNPIRQN